MWKRVAGVIGGLLVLLIAWASPQDGQKIAEGGAKWAAFGGLVAALAGLPGLIGSIVRSWRGRSSVHQSAPRHNPFNPSLAVGKTEAIAFRLLLLAWVVGGGALIYAGYADFRANMEQEPVERLFVPIRECVNNVLAVPACGQNTKLIGPCERALNQCNEWSAEARQFAAAVNRRDHWAENHHHNGWEAAELADIEFWELAAVAAQARTCQGSKISIEWDWSTLISRLKHNYRVQKTLYSVAHTPQYFMETLQQTDISDVSVSCIVSSLDDVRPHMAISVCECVLHDIFLMANLSAPGAGNFYNLALSIPSEGKSRKRSLSLHQHAFEMALIDGENGKWPSPELLPADKVVRWFNEVRNDLSQLPRNRMEMALFAMLHICMSEVSPASVVWIFYALESLFDTKPGENIVP